MIGRRAAVRSLRAATAALSPSSSLLPLGACSLQGAGGPPALYEPATNLQLAPRRCFSAEAAASSATATDSDSDAEAATFGENSPITQRPQIPANVYAPTGVEYDEHYVIQESNPLNHSFHDVGKYFPLGGEDATKALAATFPAGTAGDLKNEFAVTGTNLLCVRPTGVFLAHALEHWRQVHGRQLASAGKPVKDVDPSQPYAPVDVGLEDVMATAAWAHDNGSSSTSSSSSSSSEDSDTSKGTAAAAPGADSGKVLYAGNENPLKFSPQSGNGKGKGGPFEWSRAELDPYRGPKTGLGFPEYRMLTGPRGIGKSALLTYAVAYARANRWISVFVPDSFHVMKKGLVLVPSKRRPGKVDQHDLALSILRDTLLANREVLSNVPQRGKYASFRYLPRHIDAVVSVQREALRKQEEAEKAKLKAQADAAGTAWDPSTYKSKYEDESDTSVDRSTFTLADMAEWGLQHAPQATDALVDLLEELKQVTEYPVLVAVDGHNLLYESPTVYPDQKGTGRLLKPEELSVPAAFQCLDEKGVKDSFKMARGLYLTTVTQKHGRPMRMFAVANVSERGRLRVPEATREEVHAQLKHYAASKAFLMLPTDDSVDAFAVEYYKTLSSGRFAEVFQAATLQV